MNNWPFSKEHVLRKTYRSDELYKYRFVSATNANVTIVDNVITIEAADILQEATVTVGHRYRDLHENIWTTVWKPLLSAWIVV